MFFFHRDQQAAPVVSASCEQAVLVLAIVCTCCSQIEHSGLHLGLFAQQQWLLASVQQKSKHFSEGSTIADPGVA